MQQPSRDGSTWAWARSLRVGAGGWLPPEAGPLPRLCPRGPRVACGHGADGPSTAHGPAVPAGLSCEGWSIMKNMATELGIILIGYFTLVPAIQVRPGCAPPAVSQAPGAQCSADRLCRSRQTRFPNGSPLPDPHLPSLVTSPVGGPSGAEWPWCRVALLLAKCPRSAVGRWAEAGSPALRRSRPAADHAGERQEGDAARPGPARGGPAAPAGHRAVSGIGADEATVSLWRSSWWACRASQEGRVDPVQCSCGGDLSEP